MSHEQPTPEYSEESELERTQPSPSRPARRLDWRPPRFRRGEEEPKQEAPQVERPPQVRRVPRSARRRRRPPTEGAPSWVVGLGIGALLAVIILLVVAFVFSRRPAQAEPTPTAVVVTFTPTLVPRPTATVPAPATATTEDEATEEAPTTAPSSGRIDVGGYVRVVAPAGLSMRQTPSTGGTRVEILDVGTVLEVIGGPEEADGYTWWQLRKVEDDQEGWSAEGDGEDVFLESAPAP